MAGPCAARSLRGHALRALHILIVSATLALVSACHEEGDIQVKSLSITGNSAFKSSVITNVLATRQSGWLPWSPRHYFDRAEFDADLERIKAFYADHGYPHARVADVDV